MDATSAVGSFLAFTGITAVGCALAFALVAYCLHKPEDTIEEPKFEDQYLLEWEEMEDVEPTKEELDGLVKSYLDSDTPHGPVVMCYSAENSSFDYWTDCKAVVTFAELEAVAREYSFTRGVKRIFVDVDEELDRAQEKLDAKKAAEKEASEKEAAEKVAAEKDKSPGNKTNSAKKQSKNVFANLKSYNKASGPSSSGTAAPSTKKSEENVVVPERSNRFRFKGSMSEWKKEVEPEEDKTVKNNVSFSAFKAFSRDQEESKKDN